QESGFGQVREALRQSGDQCGHHLHGATAGGIDRGAGVGRGLESPEEGSTWGGRPSPRVNVSGQSVVPLLGWTSRSPFALGENAMRFQRLALSFLAALTVGLAPVAAHGQVIVRGPC